MRGLCRLPRSCLGLPFWLGAVATLAAMALSAPRSTGGAAPGARAAAVRDRHADRGDRLHAARAGEHGAGLGHRDLHHQDAVFGEVLRTGGVALSAEYLIVIVMTILLGSALYTFFRFTRIGVAMQAARRTSSRRTTWVSRWRASTRSSGRSARRWPGSRRCCRADHLRAYQHGLHRPKGIPGRSDRGLRQRSGRDRRRRDHRRGRGARRLLLAGGLHDIAAYIVVLVVPMARPHGLSGGSGRKKV